MTTPQMAHQEAVSLGTSDGAQTHSGCSGGGGGVHPTAQETQVSTNSTN